MSRIHEALKKAELESGTGTFTGLRSLEPETTHNAPHEVVLPVPNIKADVNLRPSDESRRTSIRWEDISENCVEVTWKPDSARNVFGNPSLNLEAAEQFRTLRSRLYQLRAETSLRVVLITSPISGDGKTFVATNLAQAIVRQADRRVLLVDADLRSPNLHIPLGASSAPGLGDYLSDSTGEGSVIQHGQDGLYFIGGGKTVNNASELLSNGRLNSLIERTSPHFDWILIDSPPCLPVADASVIASLCDGVLLVVRAGSTPLSAAQKAFQEIPKKKFIGVVLNAVNETITNYGSYYGKGRYGHVAPDDRGR
jgi:protein-tyrosine kinase